MGELAGASQAQNEGGGGAGDSSLPAGLRGQLSLGLCGRRRTLRVALPDPHGDAAAGACYYGDAHTQRDNDVQPRGHFDANLHAHIRFDGHAHPNSYADNASHIHAYTSEADLHSCATDANQYPCTAVPVANARAADARAANSCPANSSAADSGATDSSAANSSATTAAVADAGTTRATNGSNPNGGPAMTIGVADFRVSAFVCPDQ